MTRTGSAILAAVILCGCAAKPQRAAGFKCAAEWPVVSVVGGVTVTQQHCRLWTRDANHERSVSDRSRPATHPQPIEVHQ